MTGARSAVLRRRMVRRQQVRAESQALMEREMRARLNEAARVQRFYEWAERRHQAETEDLWVGLCIAFATLSVVAAIGVLLWWLNG